MTQAERLVERLKAEGAKASSLFYLLAMDEDPEVAIRDQTILLWAHYPDRSGVLHNLLTGRSAAYQLPEEGKE